MGYVVMKGPADPFRGDWYIEPETYETAELAIKAASEKTLHNYRELTTRWEEFGYEWSVFDASRERKIWEGYKYIAASSPDHIFDLERGLMPPPGHDTST